MQKGRPCPNCGSSDSAALYADGHMYCFSNCKAVVVKADGSARTGGETPQHDPQSRASVDYQQLLDTGRVKAIESRRLTQATCRAWDYRIRVNPSSGDGEHLAPYYDAKGRLVGVKVRKVMSADQEPLKDFYWIGNAGGNLFGRHKWSGGGKMLTICEGEIDTLTVSQAFDHKWPVVGVPNGAAEAVKAVSKNLEWIGTFPKVVFGFDMDGPGREAAAECAKLLAPGTAYIASWSAKDPNEMLLQGASDKITLAVHNAEQYRPDGIVDARSLTAACLGDPVRGIPWPHKAMTDWTYGRRPEEVYTIGAGSGLGKSDFLAEVIASTISGETRDHQMDYTPAGFAVFAYESGAATTKKQIAGKLAGRRFHIPHPDPDDPDGEDPGWTHEELAATLARMDNELWSRGGKLFINDSKGSADWDSVKERMRFLRHSEGIRHFLIDPISALAAGMEDERKFLDVMVLESAQISVELESSVYLVSHLTRPALGPSHEEGGQVSLKQFRGSNGIGMYSNFVFGLERNQQADTQEERSTTTIRSVKDRFTGNSVGKTFKVHYDAFRGTLDAPARDLQAFLTDKASGDLDPV